MKKAFFLQQLYWLSWGIVVAVHCVSDAMDFNDIRVIPFVIGLFFLGYVIFIFPLFILKNDMALYKNEARNNKILPIFFIEVGLWFICAVVFQIFVALYEEILLMIYLKDIEMNNLPIVSEQLVFSLLILSIGNAIGFYGVIQGRFRFNVLRMIIAIAFFLIGAYLVQNL
jgi:hypothetical protein